MVINEGEEGNWTLAIIAETDKAYTLSGEAMGAIVGMIVLAVSYTHLDVYKRQ